MFWHLIHRNLVYYRKPYLATLAGLVVSTAVLTGALIVGDSVRYSLVQMTETRLGKTQYSIGSTEHFFRQALADSLGKYLDCEACPLITTDGIAVNPNKEIQVNTVRVTGMDTRFIRMWNLEEIPLADDEAMISKNLADKLKLGVNDDFVLKLRERNRTPLNSPFSPSAIPSRSIRVRIKAIADDQSFGRFSLNSNQVAPYNVFLPVERLAGLLAMDHYANLILLGSKPLDIGKIDSAIRKAWIVEDAGLELRNCSNPTCAEIRSERIFIDDAIENGLDHVVGNTDTYLTYLVNGIRSGEQLTPYSFVTAAEVLDNSGHYGDNDIILNSWLAGDLKAVVGDSVYLSYYVTGPRRTLREDSCRFRIAEILDIEDPLFDRQLMPEFPGMTEAGSCRDWEASAPIDLSKIRDEDETYWKTYRGTPKAMITLKTGRKLWENPFGSATSYRFLSDSLSLDSIGKQIMTQLAPQAYGFTINPVRDAGIAAATNSTDFGSLFLSLSFIIILAGLLLTALLFGLQTNQRISEAAIMSTLGFNKIMVTRLLISEAFFIAVVGSIIGALFGAFYTRLVIALLNSVWQGAIGETMISVHIRPETIFSGILIGVLISLLTLVTVLLISLKRAPSSVIRTGSISFSENYSSSGYRILVLAVLFLLPSILLPAGFAFTKGGIPALVSMSAGFCLLVGLLLLISFSLYRRHSGSTAGHLTLKMLVVRNLGYKRKRNSLAMALLALGTFTIIVTGANRKMIPEEWDTLTSGTGGFLLWSESAIPVTGDLNSDFGKERYGLQNEPVLDKVEYLQLHRVKGEDASCLNLNQISKPALVGIQPEIFARKELFGFSKVAVETNNQSPWLLLESDTSQDIVPAIADQTVITWGLRRKIGDTLLYQAESGNLVKVVLMAGLENSIFQGNLLIDEAQLRKHFPAGSTPDLMLITGPKKLQAPIAERLEYLLGNYGFSAIPAQYRLAAFNQVENTYLSVFMILGGLGVLIGVFGLGIILLKTTYERRREIAVYQATGIPKRMVSTMLISEYLAILFLGSFTGIISSLYAIIPILDNSEQLPLVQLAVIMAIIWLAGIIWILLPTRKVLSGNLVAMLREE